MFNGEEFGGVLLRLRNLGALVGLAARRETVDECKTFFGEMRMRERGREDGTGSGSPCRGFVEPTGCYCKISS